MARLNNLLAISTWTVEMSIILDPMASKKKRWRVSGKRNGRSASSRFRRRWFFPCSRWFLILILCFDARFAFIRNWVLKRLTLKLWVHRFQIDREFIDLKVFRNVQKLWNLWASKKPSKARPLNCASMFKGSYLLSFSKWCEKTYTLQLIE